MATCQHCGSPSDFPYTCNYCGRKLCSDCRLPESHVCPGLSTSDISMGVQGSDDTSTPDRASAPKKKRRGHPVEHGQPPRQPPLSDRYKGTGKSSSHTPHMSNKDKGPLRRPRRRSANRTTRNQDSGSGVWVLALFVALLLIIFGAPLLESPQSTELAGPNATVTAIPTATTTATPEAAAPSLDTAAVATAIHEEINRVRQEHNRIGLAHEGRLQTAARRHSEVMAKEGAIFHEGPDGDLQERLRRAGYDCRVPMGNGQYSTGGENVAKTWYRVSIEGGHYYDTPEELARGLVEQWMDSPAHRQNILANHWRRHGAAVAVVEEPAGLAVYATQVFC